MLCTLSVVPVSSCDTDLYTVSDISSKLGYNHVMKHDNALGKQAGYLITLLGKGSAPHPSFT